MGLNRRREQMRNLSQWLRHFLGVRLWEEELQRQSGFRGFLYRQLRMFVVAGQALPRGQIPLRAAQMTVATLFAVVPGIVLAFSLLGTFGGLEQLKVELQRFIIEYLVAGAREQVSGFLDKYFAGARAFQGIGIAFLLGGVFGLLGAMENAFNQIWGIKRGRSLSRRLTTYTTIAVLGPFLVAISVTMTASLQNAQFLHSLQLWAPVEGLVSFVFGLAPLLVTILGLTMLYLIMPNAKVRVISAVIGAVVAGVLWEISKWGYALYISSATMYQTLYGPLVAIPLLFVWIQLSWIIVLFGALLTFAQDAADDFRLEEGAISASVRERLKSTLRCMIAISRAHYRGERAPNVIELAADLHIPVRLVRSTVGDLQSGGLLHEVVRPRHKGEGGLVPARDLQNLTVYDLITAFQQTGTSTPNGRDTAEAQEAERILTQLDRSFRDVGSSLSLAQVVESLEERSADEPPHDTARLFRRG
ncbi:MAG: YihY family inner membrane protein [Candidatus Eisenbacteria bacterium]|nr:YihY family inner membrane protein [Candidatus Eisenbacteria bacterium]